MAGIDLSKLVEAVERAKGVQASAKVLIEGFAERIRAAVQQALEEDASADQASIDAANAAIDSQVAELNASIDELGSALNSNS